MREIKFRGKRKDNNEWVYGDLIHHGFDGIRTHDIGIKMYNAYPVEVIPETVGQYTGYKMLNAEVYFGDLVSNNYKTSKEVIREVVEHKGNKMLKRVKGKSSLPKYINLHDFYNLNFKVVGNIHEGEQDEH